MDDLIKSYISSRELAWTPATQKSECARLQTLSSYLNGDPQHLWEFMSAHLKPYSRVTYWTRVCDFWGYLISIGKRQDNPYKEWRKKNARQFKNTYKKTVPEISYSQAQEAISKIADPEIREKCSQLLKGGLRYTESLQIRAGLCTGKGEKKRKVFVKETPYSKSYTTLYKALKSVGLSPHMLRKIRATDMARRGMREADLCKAFGWESFNTAKSYIAPINEDKMAEMFKL